SPRPPVVHSSSHGTGAEHERRALHSLLIAHRSLLIATPYGVGKKSWYLPATCVPPTIGPLTVSVIGPRLPPNVFLTATTSVTFLPWPLDTTTSARPPSVAMGANV